MSLPNSNGKDILPEPSARRDVCAANVVGCLSEDESRMEIDLLKNHSGLEAVDQEVVAINGRSVKAHMVVQLPSGATVTIQRNGKVVYDPTGFFDEVREDETAIDFFEFTLKSSLGFTDSGVARVALATPKSPPQAVDSFIETFAGSPITVQVVEYEELSGNESLDIVLLNQPTGGTVDTDRQGRIHFVPEKDFLGTVTLHYLVEDSLGIIADATLTIDVVTPQSICRDSSQFLWSGFSVLNASNGTCQHHLNIANSVTNETGY